MAAIFALIAFDPTPLAVDLLVYAAVAVTVITGADYFVACAMRLAERPGRAERPADGGDVRRPAA